MPTVNLPVSGGTARALHDAAGEAVSGRAAAVQPRRLRGRARVVADPRADNDPWLDAAIDWEQTIAFRRHLWSLGLGIAEAMDTSQRGMGMDWPRSLELIRRSLDAARDYPGALVAFAASAPIISKPDAVRRRSMT